MPTQNDDEHDRFAALREHVALRAVLQAEYDTCRERYENAEVDMFEILHEAREQGIELDT